MYLSACRGELKARTKGNTYAPMSEFRLHVMLFCTPAKSAGRFADAHLMNCALWRATCERAKSDLIERGTQE